MTKLTWDRVFEAPGPSGSNGPENPGLTFVLVSLTAARLTRLITRDQFPPIRWAREQVEARGPEWAADLVGCVWCTSFYVSAGVSALAGRRRRKATSPVLMAGAVWAVASTLAYWQGRAEDTEQEAEAEDEMDTLQMQVVDNGRVDA